VKLRTSNLAGTFTGPTEQKSIKNFGEKGAWAYPGTAQIFWVPLLSHEQVKLRTSNSVRIFIPSLGRKPIKNFAKSSHGHSQGLLKFFRALIQGASRGHLCDSSAFLLYIDCYCCRCFVVIIITITVTIIIFR